MTKRSRIGLALLAGSVGLGLAFAPAAFAASHTKKDKMEKMEKSDKKMMKKDDKMMKKDDKMKKKDKM